VFSIAACGASWATGRVLREHRALADELKQATDRIAAERAGRELLAIAEQRTRIARELQTLVASSVSTMIVQTQAAQRLLDQNSDQADAAMAIVEDTGRQALTEMRRILGVLRHTDEQPELAPQPGIGQIPALIEEARHRHRHLALRVEGEPGPLPASVDLGVYRILEDALTGVDDVTTSIDVLLRFGVGDIELVVAFGGTASLDWPSVAMRERVALCQGALDVDSIPGSGERLTIRLPRVFDGALA
jgi:signal transduction histidine kinase